MTTIIVVGNSHTYTYEGKMITPRGYGNRYDLG
jgi:precorrin-3B methylase